MFVYYLGLLGVSVFAISGSLAAGQKRLDWIGVLALATVTSLGGGTLRDLLLDREQIFWIADTSYLAVVVFSVIFTILYTRFLSFRLLFFLVDRFFYLVHDFSLSLIDN